jgi:hypothetical protein
MNQTTLRSKIKSTRNNDFAQSKIPMHPHPEELKETNHSHGIHIASNTKRMYQRREQGPANPSKQCTFQEDFRTIGYSGEYAQPTITMQIISEQCLILHQIHLNKQKREL